MHFVLSKQLELASCVRILVRVWGSRKASGLIFSPSFSSNMSHGQTSTHIRLYPGLFSLSMARDPSGLFLQGLFFTVRDFLAEWRITDLSCSFRNVCVGALPCLSRTDHYNNTRLNYLLVFFWKDGRSSELAAGTPVILIVSVLRTISCGLAATGWTAVLNLPQNSDRFIYYLNIS